MLKENVEMIQEIRRSIMRSLNAGCLSEDIISAVALVLRYDEVEAKYKKSE